MPTQSGSHTRGPPLAERLRHAGAFQIGKATTFEFGRTGVSTRPLTGIPHNPGQHGLNAGASSGGLHHAYDSAGSIRIPAHFTVSLG